MLVFVAVAPVVVVAFAAAVGGGAAAAVWCGVVRPAFAPGGALVCLPRLFACIGRACSRAPPSTHPCGHVPTNNTWYLYYIALLLAPRVKFCRCLVSCHHRRARPLAMA